MTYKLISSDSHADALPDVYLANVPAKIHDCIPHEVMGDDGKKYLVVRGQRVLTLEDHKEGRKGGPWQEVREFDMYDPDCWKPARRLEHLDRDNCAAEVIQGGATWVLFDRDPEAQMAVCRVWNDWAMDTYKKYQSRIRPSATLPIADIPGAVKEAQRLAKMGYTNVQMPINPDRKSVV